MSNKFYYGGQAVIEGVMMRGKRYWAIAVRKTNSEVTLKHGDVQSITSKYPILGKPLIRGSVALIESLVMGMRSLTYSANQFAEEEEEELTTKDLVLTIAFAFLLTVGLFIMLPAFIIRNIQELITNDFVLNLLEGAIKISFFILYIIGISFMKDIRRYFSIMVLNTRRLTVMKPGRTNVENVQKHSPIHARCGTNFMLIVLFMSAFIFTFFGRPPFLLRVGLHLAILPIVAGLSYEIIRKAGQDDCHPIFKWIAAPGKALQYLTTREPDGDQIEVAIEALKAVVEMDAAHHEEKKVKQFPKTASV